MWTAVLSILSPIIGKVIEKIPNQQERERVRLELEKELAAQEAKILEIVLASANKQTEVNAVEAANPSVFVSGWRPFCGWVAGFGCAWAFVIKPLLDWCLPLFNQQIKSPELQTGELMSLLLGMLGLGGLRTYERLKGVNNK